jgi:pimeloyl-ACP methyl ester carboxylesterase
LLELVAAGSFAADEEAVVSDAGPFHMTTRSRRVRATIVATLAVLGITAGETAMAGQDPLQWGPCPPSVYGASPPDKECANVSVPLDYSDPGGRRINVAVSRLPATSRDRRHGVLLVAAGGPGNAGLDLPEFFAQLMPQSMLERYDLIGFDMRGTGRSTPMTCGLSVSQLPVQRVMPWPDARGFQENVSYARFLAQSCGSSSTSDLLPFMTTENRARDMDRIRTALGEKKISFLGYSYDTYLGAVYVSLFPQRGDRVVLDSVVSPRAIWRETWRRMGAAIELRFPDFTRFAAERNDVYGLGTTDGEVRAKYFELGARLDVTPVTLPTGQVMDGNLFREATRVALYSDTMFAGLAELWHLLNHAGATPLAASATALDPSFPDIPQDSVVAGALAAFCGDAQWPKDPEQYRRDVERDSRLFPVAGGMAANIWPCAFWPVEPRKPPVRITSDGETDVLLIQSLRDIATPLIGALETREALGPRTRLVISAGGAHSVAYSYNTNDCINGAANSFLVDGVLRDALCPGEPRGGGVQTFDVTPSGRLSAMQELMRRMQMLGSWSAVATR